MLKNIVCGAIVLSVGTIYVIEAGRLPDSSLSDTVGASGFPLLIGWSLIGLSAILVAQSLLLRGPQRPQQAESEDSVWNDPKRATMRAAGLAAIAAVFLILLPIVGYIAALILMLGAAAVYLGKPLGRQVVTVAVGGALALWLLFVVVLNIPLPAGFFENLL